MSFLRKALKKTPPTSIKITEVEVRPRRLTASAWHQIVDGSVDLSTFLRTGEYDSPPRLEDLKQSTSEFLESNRIDRPDWEDALEHLIDEHSRVFPRTIDLAILACLHVLPLKASISHLVSLSRLETERYFRCLFLAPQVNASVVSQRELDTVEWLLKGYSGHDVGFPTMVKLLHATSLAPNTVLLPRSLVNTALIALKDFLRLDELLQSYFERGQLLSAYMAISLLRTEPELTNGSVTSKYLDLYVPSWRNLMKWKPNVDRIRQWEYGRLESSQRVKILEIIALDGPDTITNKKESLKLVESVSFQVVKIIPETIDNLERFLQLLYKAHVMGPSALDLFIFHCIDSQADENSMSIMEKNMAKNDSHNCDFQLRLIQVFSSEQDTLTRQTKNAMRFLNDIQKTSPNASLGPFSERLINLMDLVRHRFMEKLHEGSGEFMGMLVYEFSSTIKKSKWTHKDLPDDFMESIENCPSPKMLEVIFRQLEEDGEIGIYDSRLKSYLAATLGLDPKFKGSTIAQDQIQIEIDFWSKRPDAFRREIARTLAKMKTLDYTLYTTILTQMWNELDLYIQEMRYNISKYDDRSCIRLASYLSERREMKQLMHDCWPLLLSAMISDRGPDFLPTLTRKNPYDSWQAFVQQLLDLLVPLKDKLPENDCVLTSSTITWWQTLKTRSTEVIFLIENQVEEGHVGALYFPRSVKDAELLGRLMALVKRKDVLDETVLQLLSHISPNWDNVSLVYDCIEDLNTGSDMGKRIIERTLRRHSLNATWTLEDISIISSSWQRNSRLTSEDKRNLGRLSRLLQLPMEPSPYTVMTTKLALESQYDGLMNWAQMLQNITFRCRRERPQELIRLLKSLGVEDSGEGRVRDLDIPDELVDSADVVGNQEYELSFPLTEINEIKKQAIGIPNWAMLLVVRVQLANVPMLCIHFSPPHSSHSHTMWPTSSSQLPQRAICSEKPTLFGYYLSRNLHQYLAAGNYDLQSLHGKIQDLIKRSPSTCVVCNKGLGTKLWKPSSCSKSCSSLLRQAPLEVRLHNLFVDPSALDLLLTAVYSAAGDTTNLNLLPNCPIPKTQLRKVLDTFPSLNTYSTASNLANSIRGSDTHGRSRELLLSWICLTFRGFIMSAPTGYKVPSMPGTTQFMIFNSHHDKETRFNNAMTSSSSTGGPVFHGTAAVRLFSILTEGLKNMSNTSYMLHGAVSGAGIYLSDDQTTSVGFSGNIGQSWKNSKFSNMSVLLGCELAGWTAKGTHVVSQEDNVIVRYVFLLPANYAAPPRQHVAPAMGIAFSNLRAGLTT